MGGGYRTNSSDDSMLEPMLASVMVASLAMGVYLSAITSLASTALATTVTASVASVVNPARATVGLEAAAGYRQRSTGSPNTPGMTGINRGGVS